MGEGFKWQRQRQEPIVTNVYLYNEGDECTDLTGGWGVISYRFASATHIVTKNTSNITIHSKSNFSTTERTTYTHISAVDLTSFSKLKAIVDAIGLGGSGDYVRIGADTQKFSGLNTSNNPTYRANVSTNGTDIEVELDISALSGYFYIYMISQDDYINGANDVYGVFKKIWLEK